MERTRIVAWLPTPPSGAGRITGIGTCKHEEMAMHVNRTAPIVARHEIIVQAPVEAVWAAHTRIDEWPRWQPDITRAAPAGPLAVGSTFSTEEKGTEEKGSRRKKGHPSNSTDRSFKEG
jgi:hypothetical protein